MKSAENIHLENTHTEVAQLSTPEPHNTNNIIDTILFSNLINIIIVVVFFVWLFRKYDLLSFLTKKREEIVEIIKNVKQERIAKTSQLEATKIKTQNVKQERIKIIDEGEQVAETISEKIIEDAEIEAAEMQKRAKLLIESEKQVAANEIIEEITNNSFIIAEQHIKQAIDDKMHQKHIDKFIESMEDLKV